MNEQKPFRVLSLDGGGTRGIYSASFLESLCSQHAKSKNFKELDLGKGFELVVGTSTGAIVGCAVAAGIPMSRVVSLFRNHSKEIFPRRIDGKLNKINHLIFGRKFVKRGDIALRNYLDEVFGDKTIADIYEKRGISLCIPTVHMLNHNSWVFKKSNVSGQRDENYKTY